MSQGTSGFGLHNVNWKAFNPRLGLRVVIAVLVGLVLAEWFGLAGPVVSLAALMTSMNDSPGPIGPRMAFLAAFTAVMTVVSVIAWQVAGEMWPTVFAVFVVVLLGAFGMAFGKRIAAAGSMLGFWLAIWLGGFGTSPLADVLLAVLIGGGAAMVLALIFHAISSWRHGAASATTTAAPTPPAPAAQSPDPGLRSFAARFAVIKAIGTSLATLIGWLLVGSHPFWVTYAPLAIIQPDRHETERAGFNRLVGTVLGAIVGFVLIAPLQDTALLFVLFLLAIFLQMANQAVHYSLFVFFLTLNVILSGALTGSGAEGLSVERVAATIIGVAIALAIVFILGRFLEKPDQPAPAT